MAARVGVIAVAAISATRNWTTTLVPVTTLPASAVGPISGLIAGFQPAWRAAGITPAEALRNT